MEGSAVAVTSTLASPDIAYINEGYNKILKMILLFTVEKKSKAVTLTDCGGL
jgi:hypothetical protein